MGQNLNFFTVSLDDFDEYDPSSGLYVNELNNCRSI